VQLGFVIDHSRCIGCHACTVACKSENDVPVGDFRTWVKYTERGSFPDVKRSFAVLRCNQCTNPPCVTICPVAALEKGAQGIVDVDPQACIGCKSCMQACPYDALYINDASGTAEKCHFCAHRVETGLAPACAVVCPTEAIVPGDFHDPDSRVSRLKATGQLRARKTEAETGPNVFYRDAEPAGLDPSLTNTAGGYLWANQQPGVQLDAQTFEALERKALAHQAREQEAQARTTYDVAHAPLWGWKVGLYLFTKSVAAGVLLAWIPMFLALGEADARGAEPGWRLVLGSALAFLVVTVALLVGDLKRPGRFLFLLLRPNWNSWLVRGGIILGAYGLLLFVLGAVSASGLVVGPALGYALLAAAALAAAATAVYTAWLFGQAKGRVLWMRRGLALHLLAQAWAAGSAWMLLGGLFVEYSDYIQTALRFGLGAGLAVHLALILLEARLAPKGREREFHRAARLVTHGPFARRHWSHGVALGAIVPLVGVAIASSGITLAVAGALALWGLWNEEDVLVRAGQALPIS
jgi:Fe-S-cluster-containing dehydrogenase component